MAVSRETHQERMRARLSGWMVAWGLDVKDASLKHLVEFAFALSEYRDANVIGTRDVDQVLERHIADSLSPLLHKPTEEAQTLVDVGSGAGLPGIPLRICLPKTAVTLIESTGKKTAFTHQVLKQLNIGGLNVLNMRVEEVGRIPEYRGAFDTATVRAVASLAVVAEYCLPLVRVGGTVIVMKGQPSEKEMDQGARAADVLGAELETVIHVPTLPRMEPRTRCLVVLRKTSETPKRYPRRIGLPRQNPLGA